MDNMQKHNKKEKKIDKISRKGLINGFSVISVLVIIPVFFLTALFLLFFPRSQVSALEKRNLATFPKFSLSSLFSGQFTEELGTYYDDTVPYRDSFKTAGYNFKSVFGLHTENEIRVIGAPAKIPTASDPAESASAAESGPSASSASSGINASAPESASSEEVSYVSEDLYGDEEPEVDDYQNVILVKQGGHWRALELFGGGSGNDYVAALNAIHEDLGSGVTVYSMIDPLSSEYYMPESWAEYSASQNDCIESINSRLDPGIVGINVAPVLSHHTKEYIYLRTDHHWSPLGAYYAAETFAKAAGVDFKDLSTYEERVIERYVGSMYGYTGDASLNSDPDVFTYYVPSNYDKCTTYYYDSDFNYIDSWDFFYDIWEPESNAYLTFMASDEYVVKVQTNVHNGRKLMIVKDSYGNAIPGYLFGSFEEIYVADMRFFGCNLIDFARQAGITDMLFTMTSFSAVGNGESLEYLRTQYKGVPIIDGALETSSASEAPESGSAPEDEPEPEEGGGSDGTEEDTSEEPEENDTE